MAAYTKILRPRDKIVIYIEGDGHAWVSRQQLSTDPTPVNPLVQNWTLRDPRPNVAYLARPCQYVGTFQPPCHSDYWSSKRFAPIVIDSMNQAIDQIKAEAQAHAIILIGYSGGGAVAALIAARRHDISDLITVAGNLDTAQHSALHHVSPLSGSLNPLDAAWQTGSIKQRHYVGTDDRNIPASLAEHFVAQLPPQHQAQIIPVPHATHDTGWDMLDFTSEK